MKWIHFIKNVLNKQMYFFKNVQVLPGHVKNGKGSTYVTNIWEM